VARNGVAILAGDDAGPRDQRYVANLVASLFALFLALSATTANTLLHVLPISLVAALAGLAILTAFVDALQTAIATDLPMGAFFALAIAASPLTLFGVGGRLLGARRRRADVARRRAADVDQDAASA
jgi:benzoate membrane transport protein